MDRGERKASGEIETVAPLNRLVAIEQRVAEILAGAGDLAVAVRTAIRDTAPELPTDKVVPAGTNELFIGGKLQSSRGEK